jgi:hypothetical protein
MISFVFVHYMLRYSYAIVILIIWLFNVAASQLESVVYFHVSEPMFLMAAAQTVEEPKRWSTRVAGRLFQNSKSCLILSILIYFVSDAIVILHFLVSRVCMQRCSTSSLC